MRQACTSGTPGAPRRLHRALCHRVGAGGGNDRRSVCGPGSDDPCRPAAVEAASPAHRASHTIRGRCRSGSSSDADGTGAGRSRRASGNGADRLAHGDASGRRGVAGPRPLLDEGPPGLHTGPDGGLDRGAAPAGEGATRADGGFLVCETPGPIGCGRSGACPVHPGPCGMECRSGAGSAPAAPNSQHPVQQGPGPAASGRCPGSVGSAVGGRAWRRPRTGAQRHQGRRSPAGSPARAGLSGAAGLSPAPARSERARCDLRHRPAAAAPRAPAGAPGRAGTSPRRPPTAARHGACARASARAGRRCRAG